MKKILRILGSISALILSIFGITACSNNVALYGVPPSMLDAENTQIEETTPEQMEVNNNSDTL